MTPIERNVTTEVASGRDEATVLVAEDHDETRALLRFVLERAGYRVVEAATGGDAVALAESEHPDLILTDLMMPQMDGLEAIRRIRSNAGLRDIPVLAISGDGRSGIELFLNVDQFGGGFIDYIAKPFNLDSVMEQVSELVPIGAVR